MNRRNFLTNLAAGAAVVLGAGAVKGAEASEAPVISGVHTEGNTITVGSGGTLANVQVAPGYGVVVGGMNAHIENVTITPTPLPAFEDDDPATPFVGSTCFDTANNRLMYWDGQRWLGSVGFV